MTPRKGPAAGLDPGMGLLLPGLLARARRVAGCVRFSKAGAAVPSQARGSRYTPRAGRAKGRRERGEQGAPPAFSPAVRGWQPRWQATLKWSTVLREPQLRDAVSTRAPQKTSLQRILVLLLLTHGAAGCLLRARLAVFPVTSVAISAESRQALGRVSLLFSASSCLVSLRVVCLVSARPAAPGVTTERRARRVQSPLHGEKTRRRG